MALCLLPDSGDESIFLGFVSQFDQFPIEVQPSGEQKISGFKVVEYLDFRSAQSFCYCWLVK